MSFQMFFVKFYQRETANLNRCKIGLVVALIAQIAWVVVFFYPELLGTFEDIVATVSLILTFAAYIVGGGFGAALMGTWKVAKTLGVIGWVCVPFPADIVTGLMLTMMAMMVIPVLFFFMPLALVIYHFYQTYMNYRAAKKHLAYFTPVEYVENGVSEEN